MLWRVWPTLQSVATAALSHAGNPPVGVGHDAETVFIVCRSAFPKRHAFVFVPPARCAVSSHALARSPGGARFWQGVIPAAPTTSFSVAGANIFGSVP